MLKKIRDIGVAFDKELGICKRRVLNGYLMGAMGILEKSEVTILESNLTKSPGMSDFPPISREDPPELLA